jgi:hypothetical protein
LNSFTKTKKGSPKNLKKLYLEIAPKGSKIVYFPLIESKNYRKLSIIIMILENSSDYRDFDNDNLSITNTTFKGEKL